ncbi:MAG TPA: hypothetical protein VK509_14070, partial [Polyangiales bacterium]|nr:hypothetical protein [Polyangiales bacterium]
TAFAQLLLLFVPFYFAYSFDCGVVRAGQLAAWLLGALALIGCVALARPLTQLARELRAKLFDPGQRPLLLAFAALMTLFAWLHHTHYLRPLPDGLHSAGVTWGDLPLHAAFAARFLAADGLPALEHPLFLHGPLIYPFLPDYSVAVLAGLGLGLRGAFIVGGLYALASLLLLLHALARAWLGGTRALEPLLATVLFLFAGGFGFAFSAQRWLAGTPLVSLLQSTNATYDISPHIAKAGHIGNLLLASRCAAYGMPIGLAALLLFAAGRNPVALHGPTPRRALIAGGVAAGALPLVHTHSFLVIAGVLFAYTWLARPRLELARAALCFAPLVLLALPQLLFLSHGGEWSYLRWSPGFLRPAPSALDWLLDLLLGMGLAWLLVPWAWRGAPALLRRAVLPFLLLLPLANLVAFAPAPYDNIKLVAWFDLATAVLLAGWLAPKLRAASGASPSTARSRGAAVLVLIACTASGVLAVGHELANDALAVSSADLELARLVERHTPPSAVIATAASYHDPVVMVAGRRALMAAPYMVRLNGIDVRERARNIFQLYAGGPTARALIERYDVYAVVIGPAERAELPRVDEAFFAALASARYEVAGRRLYVLDRQRAR